MRLTRFEGARQVANGRRAAVVTGIRLRVRPVVGPGSDNRSAQGQGQQPFAIRLDELDHLWRQLLPWANGPIFCPDGLGKG